MVLVCFQGEPGAYSEQAAFELLGKSSTIETKGLDSFDKCFQALESGLCDYALMPIENSLGGSIHRNYDLQLRHNFFICAEHSFRVRHSLMVLPGVNREQIKKVYSHPQALAQCDGYLRSMGVEGESAYDTAGSAKMIANDSMKDCAAIASTLAAEYYQLEILEEGIEDDDNNFTRFLLLSKRWCPLDTSISLKTSVVFSVINYPGVLVKALSAFSFRDISLLKLESRPDKERMKSRDFVIIGKPEEQLIPTNDRKILENLNFPELEEDDDGTLGSRFRFIFYVDFLGSIADRKVQNAIRHLSEMTPYIRLLGCYPQDSILSDFVADAAGIPSGTTMKNALSSSSNNNNNNNSESPSSLNKKHNRLKIGIVGFGNFGQFLAKTFVKNHQVYGCSRSDYTAVAKELGVSYSRDVESMFKQAGGLDCLVISVSILSFEYIVEKLPKHLLENVLIIDVLSVKVLPKNVLQVALPENCDILCTHPMFGPESGKYSWKGLPCVYEKVRIGKGSERDVIRADLRCENFLNIFRNAGCRMVDMSCEMHDQAAAGSQFVTHFTGRMLAELKLQSTPINTKGFETLLSLVDNTCKDSFDLFNALYKCNPNASSQLLAMQQAMNSLTEQLGRVEKAEKENETRFSGFVSRISPSKTAETHARAIKLKREGKDIVTTLTVGEPDFAPPQPILDATKYAADNQLTKYTPVVGMFELRQAISDDYKNRKNVEYNPENEIVVTHGGKQAIFCAILSLCENGDEVIIPTPYWVSYPDIVRMSGAKPVFVDRKPEHGYVLSPEELEKAITPQTRMVILCNPCNPTGCAYDRDQLTALAKVLEKYPHIYILSDEIYERLVYDGLEHISFASLPGMKNRTLLVNGFAKGYAMTGYRLGYLACGESSIIKTAVKLQSQVNACPSSISQYSGIAALKNVTDEMLEPLYKGLEEKRNVVVSALEKIPNVICHKPKGAFYVFPDVSFYLGKNAKSPDGKTTVNSTTDLCNYLITNFGVALPPGDAFGAPYGVRLSYAASMEDIQKAVERLEAGLLSLSI